MNTPNPIIEELHAFREAYARRFDNDLRAICAFARARQQESGHVVVNLVSKKPTSHPNKSLPHNPTVQP